MAKQIAVDYDFQNLSIQNFKLNPLDTTSRLALSLGAGNAGYSSYDTTLNKIFFWSGSAWVTTADSVAGTMTFKGVQSSLTTEPVGAVTGDTYVMSSGGTLSFAGITFNPSAVVQVGDTIIKQDATNYVVIQGNSVPATTTTSGIVQLATNAEVITGTDTAKPVVASSLANYVTSKQFAKTYFNSSVTTTANTPLTITHNLALSNQDAFTISVKQSGSEVGVDVDSVSINSLSITTGVAGTYSVCVIGF